MAQALIHLGSVDVATSTSSVVFDNISQDYKHLCLFWRVQSSGSQDADVYFNDSTTLYNQQTRLANSPYTYAQTNQSSVNIIAQQSTLNRGVTCEMWIFDYANANTMTSYQFFSGNSDDTGYSAGGNWRVAEAITKIELKQNSGSDSFLNGGFHLYGAL